VEVAKKLSALTKVNTARERMVIFTQGPKPTIVVTGDDVTEYPVIDIADHEIVDSNGAGDCFAGGFLAGYIQGKDIPQCVAAGNYCANYILKTGGIKFATEATFDFE
jgi:adenosine kinase